MTAALRARPCPLCLAKAVPGLGVVVGVFREPAFANHVLEHHPGVDWKAAWAMPLPPAGRPILEPVQ